MLDLICAKLKPYTLTPSPLRKRLDVIAALCVILPLLTTGIVTWYCETYGYRVRAWLPAPWMRLTAMVFGFACAGVPTLFGMCWSAQRIRTNAEAKKTSVSLEKPKPASPKSSSEKGNIFFGTFLAYYFFTPLFFIELIALFYRKIWTSGRVDLAAYGTMLLTFLSVAGIIGGAFYIKKNLKGVTVEGISFKEGNFKQKVLICFGRSPYNTILFFFVLFVWLFELIVTFPLLENR